MNHWKQVTEEDYRARISAHDNLDLDAHRYKVGAATHTVTHRDGQAIVLEACCGGTTTYYAAEDIGGTEDPPPPPPDGETGP